MDKEEKEFDKEFVKDDVYYDAVESSRKILDENESNKIKSFIKKNFISRSKLLEIVGEDKKECMCQNQDHYETTEGYNKALHEMREKIKHLHNYH